MKNKITRMFVTITLSCACVLSAGAQGFDRLPNRLGNLNPPGSYSNPIYVQPVNPPPTVYPPPPVYPAPQINIQPREREYVPVYPRQERLAPRAEFERLTFIETTPYPYFPAKGDWSLPIVRGQIPMGDAVAPNKIRVPKGKSRIVIGKAKWLCTSSERNWELRAMGAKKGADELIQTVGRRFSDGEEHLVKFIVWK